MIMDVSPLAGCAAELTGLDAAQALEPRTIEELRRAFRAYPVLVVRGQRLSAAQFERFIGYLAPLERSRHDHPEVVVEQQPAHEAPSPAVFSRWESVLANEGAAPASAAATQAGAAAAEDAAPDSILYMHPEAPDVTIMTNQVLPGLTALGIVDDAHTWHSDGVHKPEPSLATALYALRNPSRGGDTEFCDMRAVFESLDDGVKSALRGRFAIHHWSKARNPRIAPSLGPHERAEYEERARGIPEMRHPAVRTHPETKRPSAFVSQRFTIALEGLGPARSEELLGAVFAKMEQPQVRYRHQWREGDLVIWDNRCVNHRACGGYGTDETREMLRATLRGDRPV